MKYNAFPILLATTFLSTSAMAITLEPTLEDGVISYSEGKETDYNFTTQEADANGNLTTKYYKIDINKDKLSTSSNISWTEVDETKKDESNVIAVQLPNEDTRYYQYAVKSTVTLNPILDTLKTEAGSLSGNYALTELGENTLPEGAKEVTINGVVYYFIPSGDDASLLSILAGTSAGSLIEDTNGIFEYNGTKYSFNTNAIPNSSFSYGTGSETDYNFTTQEADADGNLTTKYYKIDINKDKLSTSSNISWTEVDETKKDEGNVIAVKLPNNQTKYFQYSYSAPNGYSTISERINNTLATSDVTDVVFSNISSGSTSNGGAIYNYDKDNSSISIKADFIGNSATSTNYTSVNGGAIYNYYNATIGNITGDFIGNYATSSRSIASGGAVYNYYNATISYITGDFIGNYASATRSSSSANGGAIYNVNNATISDITGDFIGNYASGGYVYGGAIYNSDSASIGDITGDFIGNYANTTSYYAQGGAIYSSKGTIGEITGDFIGNYATSSGGTASGGAIYNGGSTIGDITGDFIGNYTSGRAGSGGAIYNYYGPIGDITGDFIGNYASAADGSAKGGAIYSSKGTIGEITGDFIGNYATSSGDYARGGAIYNGGSTIGDITGDFIGNYATSSGGAASGGAIFNGENGSASIGDITGDFIGNYASGGYVYGGAIYNSDSASIGDITGDFIGNYASGSHVYGGAIYNYYYGTIGDITGDFIGNYVSGSTDVYGGAIFNGFSPSSIGNIAGDFIGNYATSSGSGTSSSRLTSGGGAIYNIGRTIGATTGITGDFIGNYASSTGDYHDVYGGAIANYANYSDYKAEIGDITGDFIGNYASATGSYVYGGAIANYMKKESSSSSNSTSTSTIGDIEGDFIGNYASTNGSSSAAYGGAIANYAYVESTGTGSVTVNTTIGDIEGDFIGNYASTNGSSSTAYGGAIANYAYVESTGTGSVTVNTTIGNIEGDFIGNYAKSTYLALGGAIYTNQNMTFTSGSDTHFFTGNYTSDSRGKIYNAIYSTSATMTFDTTGGGAWVINDNIEGGKSSSTSVTYNDYDYKLVLTGNDTIDTESGTTTQYINMNNAIINAGDVKVENTTLRFGNYKHEDTTAKNWDGKGKFIATLNDDGSENLDADSVTSLTLNNAVFDISNGYLETIKLKKLTSTENTSNFIHLDVNVEKMESDIINVKGDVDGGTKLIIHATSDKDIRGRGKILFAESFGDTKGGETSFEVARVYKSPYLYDVIYEGVKNTSTPTESKDNTWYFEMNDKENPNKEQAPIDPNPDVPSVDDFVPTQPLGPIEVAPEIIGFETLPNAGLAQTNGMVYNIMRKVGVNRLFCPGCGFYDYNWDGKAFHNAWVDTTYNGLTIEAPVEIDANVWGIEAGSDIQHDLNNKLGIFASYRQGNYEMDGKGDKYFAERGSELDIDSYLAGLYYRYDNNNWYAFATLYGGMQEAEINTDDGVSTDTDGIEFGGSAEVGYSYALNKTVYVTPSLGVFYTQVNYDDVSDDYGKTVEYNDLKQVELEAGLKLSKAVYTDNGATSIYVKPSVVQTLVDGDEVTITKIGKVDTIEDETLGRIEIGGSYGFNDNWSAYGWANYTFGSDYEATSLGAGVNYSW